MYHGSAGFVSPVSALPDARPPSCSSATSHLCCPCLNPSCLCCPLGQCPMGDTSVLCSSSLTGLHCPNARLTFSSISLPAFPARSLVWPILTSCTFKLTAFARWLTSYFGVLGPCVPLKRTAVSLPWFCLQGLCFYCTPTVRSWLFVLA